MFGTNDSIQNKKKHLDLGDMVPADSFKKKKEDHHINTLDLTWGVFDIDASETVTFGAEGGHFQSLQGHRYLVTVRVTDTRGIQKITLDGSGMFECSTLENQDHLVFSPSQRLPASIPHQEFDNGGVPPTLQDLLVIMKPDIGAFNYYQLSCGFHRFQLLPLLEYFATDGVMTFSATATNTSGDSLTGSLTTSPESA